MNLKKIRSNLKHQNYTGIISIAPYLLLFVVTILCCVSLISTSAPFGDDLLFHAYRYKGTLDAIVDGQLLPQVDPYALYGFGHSWNIFYGPLPTYVAAALGRLSISWPIIINLITILSVLLSGILMYRFIYEVSQRKPIGIIAAILYMTAPYHLFDIFSRQAHGEIIAFIFVPLVFHGLWRIVNKVQTNGIPLLVIGAAGLILTHSLSTALVAAFSFLYLLLNIKLILSSWKKIFKYLMLSLLIIVGLSAFFILPLIEARNAGIYNIFDDSFLTNTMAINANFLNSWRIDYIDLIVDPKVVTENSDSKPFSLEIITIVSLLLLVVSYRFIPKTNKYFIFTTSLLLLLTLLLSSKAINWILMPNILWSVQFPWRYLFAAVFFSSIISAYSLFYFVEKLSSLMSNDTYRFITKKIIMSVFILIIIVISLLSSDNILPKLNSINGWSGEYNYKSIEGIGGGEYLPSTNTLNDKETTEIRIKDYLQKFGRTAISNTTDVKILNYQESGSKSKSTLVIKSPNKSIITLPYIYYPGYKALYTDKNGVKTMMKTSPSPDGFLDVHVESNIGGELDTRFGTSGGTLAGILISVLTLLICVIMLLKKHIKGQLGRWYH
jgi:hypothetical protein